MVYVCSVNNKSNILLNFKLTNKMKITPEMQADYESYKEKGDLVKLKKITGIKSTETMCRIMKADRETTVSNVAKIQKFLNKRKLEIASLTETE